MIRVRGGGRRLPCVWGFYSEIVYFHQNKKRRGPREGKCHTMTMMSTKSNEREWLPLVYARRWVGIVGADGTVGDSRRGSGLGVRSCSTICTRGTVTRVFVFSGETHRACISIRTLSIQYVLLDRTRRKKYEGVSLFSAESNKRRGPRERNCHTKTMMSTKANETLKWTLSMYLLGRTRRKKYEGRSQKRCGTTRTDETRQRYEWPRWRSRGIEIRIADVFVMIKPTVLFKLTKHTDLRNGGFYYSRITKDEGQGTKCHAQNYDE
jgi:hypothetical protein